MLLVNLSSALWLMVHKKGHRERVFAAVVVGIAIPGMHYMGVAAASFDYVDRTGLARAAAPESAFALAIGGVTLALLLPALLVAYFNRRMSSLAAHEAAALRESAELLGEQVARFDWAIDNMAQGLCMFDRNRQLVVFNRPYAELYRLQPEDMHLGASFDSILEQRLAAGNIPLRGADAFRDSRTSVAESGEPRSDLIEMVDGRFIQIIHRGLPDGGWVATHQDVTEQRRMEAQIRFLAQHDPLTALPNRSVFRERMAELEPRMLAGELFSVLFLDLDRFKPVNDTYGHSAGDAVLTVVAGRLRGCAGSDALVARLGGDEFAIVKGPLKRVEEAAELARSIVESVRSPIEVDGHVVAIDTSVGIAVAPEDGTEGSILMRSADLALYRSKADGKGVYRFFKPGLDAALQDRERLVRDLGGALAAGQLSLVYQPLVNLKRNRISGFEALLRWRHPERGNISPAEFIPLAEETGLINIIGEWVIRSACRQMALWPDEIFVSVNLSPLQFRQGTLVQTVVSALAANGVSADRLELEITETALLTNSDAVLKVLEQLRGLGIRIALDDFGTGFASLSYLQTFPFDKLKVDRSFLKDLSSRPQSKVIVKAIAALGHGLGMITTAEGVETANQLHIVRQQGYTEAQGYFFSVPLAVDEATKLLDANIRQWPRGGPNALLADAV